MASDQIVTADQVLAAPPADVRCFETSRPIRTGDVDTAYRLRLDGVARYLLDIGTDNLAAFGFDRTDPLWIVRRTVIDVHRAPTWPNRVHLRRWCSAHSTRWSSMRVQLTDDEDALIETEGFWINIGTHSGMPARISDGLLDDLGRTTEEHRLRWRPWLPSTPPRSPDDRAFPLRVTDIDPFNHVNNAAYWHAVEEVLADRPDLLETPHRAIVEHLSPIFASDNVVLRALDDGPALSLWFLVDGAVRAAARVQRL
ncbi:acyl-ACP thioesterase domain-containing protein [Rhodococcus sp. ABRD24]|uniref:acyl-[acyl-carrier-protein] thioesterase n=1 Tax=Rhodococcus sp. ABRD24 TaxID=2507582 RepID=UPI001F626136|nr:acyl-ACP thioesterase domain-containing protein [Rhodococcus sp. ABRD24]